MKQSRWVGPRWWARSHRPTPGKQCADGSRAPRLIVSPEGSHVPTAKRTVAPARIFADSLTPDSRIREPKQGNCGSRRRTPKPTLMTPSGHRVRLIAFTTSNVTGKLVIVQLAVTWGVRYALGTTVGVPSTPSCPLTPNPLRHLGWPLLNGIRVGDIKRPGSLARSHESRERLLASGSILRSLGSGKPSPERSQCLSCYGETLGRIVLTGRPKARFGGRSWIPREGNRWRVAQVGNPNAVGCVQHPRPVKDVSCVARGYLLENESIGSRQLSPPAHAEDDQVWSPHLSDRTGPVDNPVAVAADGLARLRSSADSV